MRSHDNSQSLTGRLDAARLSPPSFEAKRLLGDLQTRLFGVASEPVRIGRFVVLRRLGAGGMGIVYLGYDGELDRNVALKLLHTHEHHPARHAQATQRLRREARALARVDHPNVVAVHEVGEHDGSIFIAMELVAGTTMAAWQTAKPRPWPEVLDMYMQAGRGLAAAHAAGVIHRDLKPENILVGDDGRARVVDFGLALAETSTPDPPSDSATKPPQPSLAPPASQDSSQTPHTYGSNSSLTATGAVLGTPAYMAPEQRLGHYADARSDQFSFGLALYEALCGQRAFAGNDADAIADAMVRGAMQPIPSRVGLPRWLRRVLARCLSVDPQARYPAMTALLGELEAGLRRRRRRVWLSAMAVTVVASAVAGSVLAAPETTLCTQAAAILAPTWNDEVRATTAAAFTRTEQPFASIVWTQTQRRLDAYADAWVEMHNDACASTHLRGEQSGEVLTLRMRCLDRRRAEFAALVELLGKADEQAVRHAIDAADALTPVRQCVDSETLAAAQAVPDHPQHREIAQSVRSDLARAKVLRDAGHPEAALSLATETFETAKALEFRPLLAEAGLLLGGLQAHVETPDAAATTLEQAFIDALATGHSETAAWTAIVATHVVGALGRHPADGRRWASLAEPLLEHSGDDPRARASLHANLGNLAVHDGDLVAARNHFEAALTLVEAAFGRDDVMLARNLSNLATVHRRNGDYAQALAAYQRAREIFVTNLGAQHPALATLANNLGALHQTMGAVAEAERSYREVLAMPTTSLPPTSPTRGHAHNNLAELLLQRDRPDEAVEHADKAVKIWEQSRGASHPLVATALLGLGRSQLATAHPDAATAALANLERAREIHDTNASKPADAAEVSFELARAIAKATPENLPTAVALAEAALADLPEGPLHTQVTTWMLAHERSAPVN